MGTDDTRYESKEYSYLTYNSVSITAPSHLNTDNWDCDFQIVSSQIMAKTKYIPTMHLYSECFERPLNIYKFRKFFQHIFQCLVGYSWMVITKWIKNISTPNVCCYLLHHTMLSIWLIVKKLYASSKNVRLDSRHGFDKIYVMFEQAE